MELQEIEVFIEKDGSVRLAVHGVKGMACLDLTKEVERALGGHVESREMTHEAYERGQEQVQERQWERQG